MMRSLAILLLSCVAAFGQRYAITIATNVVPSQGDILVWSGSAWVTVAKGTTGQVLKMSGTNLVWGTDETGGGGGAVDSVFGRTGAVTADGADYDDFYQGTNSLLTAVAGLGSNGLVARTGSGSAAARTITGDSEIVVSNGDGVSGNPTLSIGSGITRDAEAASLYQPLDATLTAVAGASTAANTLVYFTAADTASVATFTAFGRSLVDDASASDARTTLGLEIGTHVQAWDTDLDDLSDGTLSGSKIGTGIDAGNITAGTLAEARIDAAIARVSALAAYAGLSVSNNFSGTNNFAGPINAATLTVNDDAYAAGWDGSTNVPTKNAIYDKIESLSAGSSTEWDSWDQWETRSWSFNGNTISLVLEPGLTSAALSSGVVSRTAAIPEFDGRTAVLFRTATGASTSTGGFIFDNGSSKFLTERANQFKADFVLNRTNGAVYALGYGDSASTTESTDALRLSITNDMVYGVAISNTVKAVTATGFQLLQGVSYSGWILQTNNYASFIIKSNVFGESAVTVWSDVLTNGLPISSARSLGLICGGWNTATANTNGVDLLYIDTIIDRKQK